MNDYRPDSFRDLAETRLGRDLWAFVNQDVAVARLEVASDLGHAAVAGIGKLLLEGFPNDVTEDRVKQMIGHMVRQVMESRGYRIEEQHVAVPTPLFATGSRYRYVGSVHGAT